MKPESLTEAIVRLQIFAAHVDVAMEMARVQDPNAKGIAGIGYELPDGEKKLLCDFDSGQFREDLRAVLAELTERMHRELS